MIISVPKRSIQAEKMLWQRKLAEKTQAEMAQLIGVDLKTYTNWENGHVDLTIDKIKRFASALQIDYKVIWNEDDFIRRANPISGFVSEPSPIYENLNDKDALITALREEVEYLRSVNKALAISLNQLNGKK